MTLADDVRAILLASHSPNGRPKDEARELLVRRKREKLRERYDTLKRVESKALSLLARVDYSNIQPALAPVSPADMPVWAYLRNVLSSAPYEQQAGRATQMFVIDRRSRGVMGVVMLSSDLDALGPRDRYIGWTRVEKYRRRRMNNVANMTTCVVTEPFGLLTGGKCASAMVVSRETARLWQRKYREPLAGCSTTSLYGKSSQYNRLPMWKYLGVTPGLGIATISGHDYALIKRFVAESGVGVHTGHGSAYGGGKAPTIEVAARLLDVPRPSSGMPKGVYFAEYGDSAKSFLRAELDVFEPDAPSMSERAAWWLERWYAMRWPKVRSEVESFDALTYALGNQMRQSESGRSIADAAGHQPDDGDVSRPTAPTASIL